MKSKQRQAGIAMVEILLLIVMAALVAFVAYRVQAAKKDADKQLNQSTSSENQSATSDSSIPNAPNIKSSSDLKSAEQTLDQINPDDTGTDEAQLNDQLKTF